MALTDSAVTTGWDDTAGTLYTGATVSYATDDLFVVLIHASRTGGVGTPTVEFGSGGPSGTQRVQAVINASPARKVQIFTVAPSGSGSGALRIDFGANTHQRCSWVVRKITGADTNPTWNTGKGDNLAVSNPSCTLTSAPASTSIVYAAINVDITAAASISQDTGWALLYEGEGEGPNSTFEAIYDTTSPGQSPGWNIGDPENSSICAIEVVEASGGTTVNLTGQQSSAAQGSLTVSLVSNPTVALSGQAASAAQGAPDKEIAAALSGQQAASAQGTPAVGSTVVLGGQAATSQQGALGVTVGDAVALSGQQAAAAQGSATVNIAAGATVALSGQAVAAARGAVTLSTDAQPALAGQAAAAARGAVVVDVGGNASTQLAGQQAAAVQGTATVSADGLMVIGGQETSAGQGSFTPTNTAALTGQGSATGHGALSVITDATRASTGLAAAAGQGSVAALVPSDQSVPLTGYAAASAQGNVVPFVPAWSKAGSATGSWSEETDATGSWTAESAATGTWVKTG